MQAIRTVTAAVILLCAAAPNSNARSTAVEPMTTIVGVVRNANAGTPLRNATVRIGDGTISTSTDSIGRFVLQTSRVSSFLAVSKEQYLEFQFPVLELTTDTLFVDIGLRTDPPMLFGSNPRFLPSLCIVLESPKELVVTDRCEVLQPAPEGYTQKLYKHHPGDHPGSLYFGPAGDNGGIVLRKRVLPSR